MKMASLAYHPFLDKGRTVQHSKSLRLTRVEETNGFEIHEIQLFQIQSDWRFLLDLGFHLIKVLHSKLSAQPNSGSALVRNPFNPQGHEFSDSETHARKCNNWAILKCLKMRGFERPAVLIFQEFLWSEENRD